MSRGFVHRLLVLPFTLLLTGCIFDATIDAKGAGTMTIKYRLAGEAQFDSVRKLMESPEVTVTEASIDKDNWGTFQLKFADVTKLSTAKFFKGTTITLADAGDGTKTLAAKIVNKNPGKLSDPLVEFYGKEMRVSLTLPGEVVKSNATTTKDTTVTWSWPLNDFCNAPETALSATFKVAGLKPEPKDTKGKAP